MMWCFVAQPNSVVLEVKVDSQANGQICLDKVCEQLGIIEVDYFGLQYEGAKGEHLWLNTRNSICRQLQGRPPYRLQMRVKFYVQPHLLLQDTTRYQFFLNIKHDFAAGVYKTRSTDETAQLIALMVQAEHGDFSKQTALKLIYKSFCPEDTPDDVIQMVFKEHEQLAGMTAPKAVYQVLSVVSAFQDYGIVRHLAKDYRNMDYNIDVGPEGISLYNAEGAFTESITYPTVHMVTNSGKCVYLTIMSDQGETKKMWFLLVSKKAANGLYRCVTEMHSFYRCDTVRNAVSSQYSRDIKGTIISIFNENTTLGKNYVFDIRRTCREVHDYARRVLYSNGAEANKQESSDTASDGECGDGDECDCVTDENKVEAIKARLEKYEDSMLCRVCMAEEINTAFIPCGHLICCVTCSSHVEHCPICRSDIENIQQIYMPMSWR
ncbi:E3 ubiquitin-protein ligase MYLIP-like [Lineus longissimus]|uniref:E3 ubiquitin-protein ligase MYLIP-like n=1 Tax=Lineus longissimus TaxID=88925 RepID=UPI002B4C8EF5